MRLSALKYTGYKPSLPLSILLADVTNADNLQLLSLLYVLPGRQYIGAALWRGRPVLAKLMVGNKAARYFQREINGLCLLAEQGLKPLLLAQGFQKGEGGWLLFEYLQDFCSLADTWRAVEALPPLADKQAIVVAEALNAIAQMHAKGLWEKDLLLDNILRYDGKLYFTCNANIYVEEAGKPLSHNRVLENLGVFLAQLPKIFEPYTKELLSYYLQSNNKHTLSLEDLQKQVRNSRARRMREFLANFRRECKLFSVKRGAFSLRAIRREDETMMLSVLNNADALLAQGHLSKAGGTATVAKIEVAGRPVMIKRYNIKGFSHWLGRFWRPSRAWHSWCEGNRLVLLGIATPKPLAVLEKRFLGLRGKAYLITEFLPGSDIIARFAPYIESGDVPENELLALDNLFAEMLREHISHGDFKGHNLFWHKDRWSMIDLDTMRQHSSLASFIPAFAKDRARFMRNWPIDSALYQRIDNRLPKVPR